MSHGGGTGVGRGGSGRGRGGLGPVGGGRGGFGGRVGTSGPSGGRGRGGGSSSGSGRAGAAGRRRGSASAVLGGPGGLGPGGVGDAPSQQGGGSSSASAVSPADAAMLGMQVGSTVAGPPGSLVGAGMGFLMAGGLGDMSAPDRAPVGSRGGGGPRGNASLGNQDIASAPLPPADEGPPSPPTSADAAAKGKKERQNRLRGKASTILTGGQGLLADPTSLRVRTLMGA